MINSVVEVSIEKLVFGGYGLARHSGQVIFVPFSAPGDLLKVKIIYQKKKTLFAEIVSIEKPGPNRRAPPCPVFGKCGGCHWQHLEYSNQVQWKQKLVEDQLSSLLDKETKIHPPQPSPAEWNYRNRIKLKWDGSSLGFFERKSHVVVGTTSCKIASHSINSQFASLLNSLKNVPKKEDDIEVYDNSEAPSDGSFSQVNDQVNFLLKNQVLNWLNTPTSGVIFDFYAGSGNFSFPIQKEKKVSVIGVESSQKSVKDARAKIQTFSLKPDQIEFYLSDVEMFLKRYPVPSSSAILLDPPREGITTGISQSLRTSDASQILYISCDPATLYRDLKALQPNYRVKQFKVFDMFPQTSHIETLVDIEFVH